MYQRIVVPLDGTELSERVLPQVRTPSDIDSARIAPRGSMHTWPGRIRMSVGVSALRHDAPLKRARYPGAGDAS